MPLEIITQDITTVHADAIVNAANEQLLPGEGECGAIFRSAGYSQLHNACQAIGHCAVGQSVITKAFHLPACYIIHTVGPVWRGGHFQEEALLCSCYQTSLQMAVDYCCRSIALPLISAGSHGYPEEQAVRIALDTIRSFLAVYDMTVYLVLFKPIRIPLRHNIEASLRRYLVKHYTGLAMPFPHSRSLSMGQKMIVKMGSGSNLIAAGAPLSQKEYQRIEEMLSNLDASFTTCLFQLIDESGMSDVEVYKRANIDRKLFSKIRRQGYVPRKGTILALIIALRLNVNKARELLKTAGYALSSSSKSDMIVKYFIEESRFDIFDVNEALYSFCHCTLGAISD